MRVEQRARIFRASGRVAGQRGIEIGIGQLDQALELVQFGVRKIRDFGVGKAAEDEVHLARAAMPAAKQKPLAAVVEPVARSCRIPSLSKFHPNAKSPDVPGGVDIAIGIGECQPFLCAIYQLLVIAGLDPAIPVTLKRWMRGSSPGMTR